MLFRSGRAGGRLPLPLGVKSWMKLSLSGLPTRTAACSRLSWTPLNGKRAEVVSIAASVAPVLRIRELEIYHKHRRVFMAGKEVHLNHGEYTMLYCMASSPGQVFSKAQLYEAAWGGGGGISKRDKLRGEYHLAAETETGT